jgi:hypothetical protein
VSRSWTKLILPVSLAVFAVVWCVRSGNTPPNGATASPPGVAGSGGPVESYPLLEGLGPGSELGEWKVSRIVVNESVDKKPQLAIEMERKGSGITVWVARKENVKNAPGVTQKYALTFGHPRPYGEPIPDGAAEAMMQKIAERVRRSEATAPVPAGL